MSTQRIDEEAIFKVAREIRSADAQLAYLDQVCAEDALVRGRILSLLRSEEEAPDFLESPAAAVALVEETTIERPGSQIGPYKLLEQVGEGGMGLVYMAEQVTPVRRRVAVKIIKPGLDTRQVIARFEAERQALALMDHPNIARVLDAGATESGRPYFVMELVRGVPITEFCDAENLSVFERLNLFVQVCQAVQHAHQKGIIHRDLKPSNVLVTLHDGRPVPKVIDFGVAKAINQQLTERTLFTNFAQMIGTPLYMSPEQAEMSGLDVDTRSDIYSLGVLLYELLTGTTPCDKTRMQDVPYDEMRRIIREEEPRRPSAFVDTLGQTRTITAIHRRVYPDRLAQLLRGDLDWIVIKALEKDRARRYATASGLARDIERYMRDELVEARPPSATYRFSKFARRNRVALTTVAIVCVAMILGTIVSAWQAIRARRAERMAETALLAEAEQRVIAETERRQADLNRERVEASFQAAQRVIDERIDSVREDDLLSMPALKPLRQDQLSSTLGYYRQFIEVYHNDPTVKAQLAAAYRRVGALARTTSDDPQALVAYQEAVTRYEQLIHDEPGIVAHRGGLAATCYELGLVQNETARPAEAKSSFQRALALLDQLDSEEHANPESQLLTARACTGLGQASNSLSRPGDAEKALRRAVSIYGRLASNEQQDVSLARVYASETARAQYQLGVAQRSAGRLTDAEDSLLRSCRAYELLNGEQPSSPAYRGHLARAYHDLGSLYRMVGKPAEAEAAHKRALALYEQVVIDHPTVAEYHMGLGWARYKLGCHQLLMSQRSLAEKNWLVAANEFAAAAEMGFSVTGAYKALGDSQAMLGRWQDAADAYARVAEAYRFAAVPTLQWALLQLAAGDEAGYRAACNRVVSEHAATAEGNLALLIVMTFIAGDAGLSNSAEIAQLAQRVAARDPRNPIGEILLRAVEFRVGQRDQTIIGLQAALPKLALAELAAPTKRDYVRLARLAGETILALACRDQGDRDSLAKKREALRSTIDTLNDMLPQYSDGTNEWTLPLAIRVASRELAHLDSEDASPFE